MTKGYLGLNFPETRLRRTRISEWSRAIHAENNLSSNDLIWPIIIREGSNIVEPISSLPGVSRLTIDKVVEAASQAQNLGIRALALFPFTRAEDRSPDATLALDPNNLMCRAASEIKAKHPTIGLMADVALDPYTDHGHDGILDKGEILNDETVDVLTQQAVLQAKAGFDIVAPSDMMDGRVSEIRRALEASGLKNTQIMSYAAKYASGFYGPYRDAIGASGVLRGNKKTYQMDPNNVEEALREVAMDLSEGADSIMIKPAGAYLDVIHRVKEAFGAPTFAFQVSGEYAMIQSAAQNGWLEQEQVMMESLIAIKRAGATGILTYFAPKVAELLRKS